MGSVDMMRQSQGLEMFIFDQDRSHKKNERIECWISGSFKDIKPLFIGLFSIMDFTLLQRAELRPGDMAENERRLQRDPWILPDPFSR